MDQNLKQPSFFFLSGFFSRTLTIHSTAGVGGVYLFNTSLPLPPESGREVLTKNENEKR